jgi:hypothetical protein
MSYNWKRQLVILFNVKKNLLLKSVEANQYVFPNSTVTPNNTAINQTTSVGSY